MAIIIFNNAWANGPADLYDIDHIKSMTLEDLNYQERFRRSRGDNVQMIYGTWSNGEWNTFDSQGNPQMITLNQSGFYRVKFNAQNLATGVYFYRIRMKDFMAVKKMVLLE